MQLLGAKLDESVMAFRLLWRLNIAEKVLQVGFINTVKIMQLNRMQYCFTL